MEHIVKQKKVKHIRGFTMVEMLIALTITAMLLTAVAAALNASSLTYTTNKDMFNAANSTRLALLRITSEE